MKGRQSGFLIKQRLKLPLTPWRVSQKHISVWTQSGPGQENYIPAEQRLKDLDGVEHEEFFCQVVGKYMEYKNG